MTSPTVARLNAALEGRYRIEGEVGEGGMATVYRSADLRHDRTVALKVLKPELAAVVGAERFLAEIKTTANLQHPHILPLFDSGEADGFLFYVMPFIEGETLRERIDRERQLPVDEALGIATAVARALEAAHEQGVVHRDIKPANILLSRGQPLVADFGIALAVSAGGRGRLTETGLSVGTPYYMSPEQATGDQAVGPGSDTFALGCVLYEMLVGEPPYPGSSAQAVLGKIIQGAPVSAREVRPSVPPNVDAAIRTALEKLPADRFRSAGAFAEALANPAFGAGTHGAGAAAGFSAGPSLSRTIVLAGVTGVLLGLAGFLAGRAATPESTPRVARFGAPAPAHIVEVVACCGPAQTVSPDGEWLVYVGVSTEGTMLYRRRVSELDDEPIAGTEGASSPFFSPDGRFVGYFADGRIRRIPLTGGASVSVAEVGSLHGGSWGDNDLIVFTTVGEPGANLWTVPASGGDPRPVPIESDIRRMYPWMLPGGTAALARVGTSGDSPIVAVDLATGREDTLGVAGRVAFASGHLVTWVDGTLLAQPFDPERRRALGPAVALLDGVGYGGPGVGAFAMSREGTLVYVADSGGGESTLVIEGPGGSEVAFTFEFRGGRPVFSPDGRRIAMTAGSGDGASASERGIWLWDRDQRTRQLLVPDGQDPTWTPDGRGIAFSRRDGEGRLEIYGVPADGSGPAELLFAPDSSVRAGSWTPDGTRLLFASRAGPGNWDIGIVDPAAGEIRWLAREEALESGPVVSPDGRWVAYVSDRSGQDEVYVRALDGSGGVTQVSAGGGRDPQWAPSGSALYYARAAPYAARAPLVRAQIAFDGVPSVVDRVDGSLVGTGRVSTWAVGTREGEFAFVTPGTDGEMESRPTFVWVLGWPELVRGLSGG